MFSGHKRKQQAILRDLKSVVIYPTSFWKDDGRDAVQLIYEAADKGLDLNLARDSIALSALESSSARTVHDLLRADMFIGFLEPERGRFLARIALKKFGENSLHWSGDRDDLARAYFDDNAFKVRLLMREGICFQGDDVVEAAAQMVKSAEAPIVVQTEYWAGPIEVVSERATREVSHPYHLHLARELLSAVLNLNGRTRIVDRLFDD
jgi:hypothetical protein